MIVGEPLDLISFLTTTNSSKPCVMYQIHFRRCRRSKAGCVTLFCYLSPHPLRFWLIHIYLAVINLLAMWTNSTQDRAEPGSVDRLITNHM